MEQQDYVNGNKQLSRELRVLELQINDLTDQIARVDDYAGCTPEERDAKIKELNEKLRELIARKKKLEERISVIREYCGDLEDNNNSLGL